MVIRFDNREDYYFRNQLVIVLSNPKVQDYVFGVVDNLMTKYPEIAYIKWDCNSPITNIYSSYLKDKQSHLYIDYVKGLYNVLEKVNSKYPNLPIMLCSGGGGRCDYEALKYFPEFWASDNTDPVERIFIQWGFSYIFPTKSIAAHVTSWGKQPLKFRTDVASMGRLGFDIRVNEMNDNELKYCQEAVQNFKRLMPVTLDGDQYRLVSPYDGDHAAIQYNNGNKSVLYTFDINPRYNEQLENVKLKGLNPDKNYNIQEINLMPGSRAVSCSGKVYSGSYLMNIGLPLFSKSAYKSHVLEITEQ